VPVTAKLTVDKFRPKKPSRQFLPFVPMSRALFVSGSRSVVILAFTAKLSAFEPPKVALSLTTNVVAVRELTPVTLLESSIMTAEF
jgi:hypothetical protein